MEKVITPPALIVGIEREFADVTREAGASALTWMWAVSSISTHGGKGL